MLLEDQFEAVVAFQDENEQWLFNCPRISYEAHNISGSDNSPFGRPSR